MKEYIIYHIPGVKIGCTNDLGERMRKQGSPKYEILETHSDIYTASQREIELQKQYGYPIDKNPYYKIIKIATKQSRVKGGKIVGINCRNSDHMKKMTKNAIEANKKAIIQFDKNGNKIKEWDNILECSLSLKIDNSSIGKVCRGKLKSCGGYTFQYKE